jgi:hypothetical protein
LTAASAVLAAALAPSVRDLPVFLVREIAVAMETLTTTAALAVAVQAQ